MRSFSVAEIDRFRRILLKSLNPFGYYPIAASFLDLLDRTIYAARRFTTLDLEDTEKLKMMARDRDSIFLAEEQRVALDLPVWKAVYPGCPHECGGHSRLG